jgi:transposase
MIQAVLGIDISKDTFDVVLLMEGKSDHEKFENTQTGFQSLNRWLKKHKAEHAHACMEATGQYGEGLAEYLYQQGYPVSVVNPARIKAYASSKLRRNKTDKADAALIAEYCLREKPPLWSPPPASFKELQGLVRRLDDLQANFQAENNRLQSGVTSPIVLEDLRNHIAYLNQQIQHIKQAIQDHIQSYPELKRRQELLVSIPVLESLPLQKSWAKSGMCAILTAHGSWLPTPDLLRAISYPGLPSTKRRVFPKLAIPICVKSCICQPSLPSITIPLSWFFASGFSMLACDRWR